MSGIRGVFLQKKLDLMDVTIGALEQEKAAVGDKDLPRDIEEAKNVLHIAREAYNRGALVDAWLLSERAEYCVAVLGRIELETWKNMMDAMMDAIVNAREK